jgi:hypothetical protein
MFAAIFAITAGSVFAQFTLDGYINTGLGLVITDRQTLGEDAKAKSVDPYLTAFGVDSEQWGYRFQLNGTYTNEEKTAGAKFRIRSQVTDLVPFMHYASGWVNFLNVFTLTGGLIDDGTWNSGGGILDSDQGEGLGLLLKISPIAGLDLGFGAYAIRSLPSLANFTGSPTASQASPKINLDKARYTFNAAYASDAFKFVATFRPDAKDFYDPLKPATPGTESMQAIAAFHLRAVPGLTAIVEGQFDNLQDFDKTGKVNIFETVGYSAGDLGVGLNAGEYILQAENTDMGIRLNPWVTYAIGNIVPRLDVVYFLGGRLDGWSGNTFDTTSGALDTEGAEGKYHRKAYAASNIADDTVLTIRPSVKFNVDGKTTIEIGDAINIETRKDTKAFGVEEPKDSRFTNIFYIDVKFSF